MIGENIFKVGDIIKSRPSASIIEKHVGIVLNLESKHWDEGFPGIDPKTNYWKRNYCDVYFPYFKQTFPVFKNHMESL
jgi:hypothetical protein